jgi:hypothetical protein
LFQKVTPSRFLITISFIVLQAEAKALTQIFFTDFHSINVLTFDHINASSSIFITESGIIKSSTIKFINA